MRKRRVGNILRLGTRYWNPELGDWDPFCPIPPILYNTIGYIHNQHDNMGGRL